MIQYIFFLRKYSCGIPSENADMSNEKESDHFSTKGKSWKPPPKAYGFYKVTASKFTNLRD
jgi:hypothetical protein